MSRSKQQVSVSNLQFAVYNRPAHPELFKIDHRQDVEERMYWASLWLIEGGHVVTFCWKGNFIVEILAGAKGLRPRRGLLQRFALRGEKTYQQSSEAGLDYIMAGQVERMSPRVFSSTYQDLLARAQSRGTLFLRGDSRAGDCPFGYAEIEARGTELHITTCQAFPDELAMARTQSIFKAPGRTQRQGRSVRKASPGHSSSK